MFDEQYLLWGFDREVAVRDLQASIAYLWLDNSSRKVGVVRFEMGSASLGFDLPISWRAFEII